MTPEEMEQLLRKDAAELVKTEPFSKLMLEEQILNRKNFADMLGVTLACQLAGEVIDRTELEKMFRVMYEKRNSPPRPRLHGPSRTATVLQGIPRFAGLPRSPRSL